MRLQPLLHTQGLLSAFSASDTGNGGEQGVIFGDATTQRREGFRRGAEARLPAARRREGDFFEAIGFSAREPESLRDALLGHARRQEVSRTLKTPFGVKYVLDGPLKSPNGRDPETRSVWIVETGGDRPRFLTAFPL